MATKSKDRPVASSAPTRYEDDVYTWVHEQVALLRAGKLTEIDAENVVEELDDVGKEQLHKLESAIEVLTMHLLKWDYQPMHCSLSWMARGNEQRKRINRVIKRNPGLKPKVPEAIKDGYPIGRDQAVAATNLPYATFPEACPYSFDDMMARPIEYEELQRKRRKR